MIAEEKTVAKSNAGSQSGAMAAPSISLPKGGGAIRGIGEKFAANPVTGTGSMTVPIATSPGRSGFGPQLSLSYDSGTGNGPFGFGWNLALPAITRKTDKGLPQYLDAQESDVFILSGSEDLVPVLRTNANGDLEIHDDPRTIDAVAFRVRRYRPRIENLFARIERWTNTSDEADVFWRSISKDNITTWYGRTAESQIADPADPSHIFAWLIRESYDDKGNVIVYGYKAEDSARILEDSAGNVVPKAHERNRTDQTRAAERFLKRIRYGNRAPYLPELKVNASWPEPPGASDSDGSKNWLFEVVFDYGEHDQAIPNPSDNAADPATRSKPWPVRLDPFSSYRSGFEVRTYRLCRRVLMFHHFATELGMPDYLVRSTEFSYNETPIASFITQVTQSGYVWQTDKYLKKSLPPLEFEYTQAEIDETVREVDPQSLENIPIGLDGNAYQWVDLDGEGTSGILTEQGEDWFYKRNLSPINLVEQNGSAHLEARFAPVELIASKPAVSLSFGRAQFLDLAGDGQLDLVQLERPVAGFYERTDDSGWESFRAFESLPNVSWNDPNLKFVDLTGDGHADVLLTEDEVLRWHPSLAEEGFGPSEIAPQSRDEEKGPKIVFADGTQSIYLADLSGDGLTDLVRIRNGEICYWPNLGYGLFGTKVTMDNSPWFDFSDQFDQKRIRLADIDGSGTTDILYLASKGIDVFRNQCGNSWSNREPLTSFPAVDNLSAVQVIDLLGNGTACLVWSSPLAGDAGRPMRYTDLMGGQKPHLLVKTVNNLGAETVVTYAPSTKFYLQDKLAGNPWITKLPFPVHVVERVETYDRISRNRFVTCYSYHHGYFDGEEREFRGFGMVEQWDTEQFAALSDSENFPTGDNVNAASHVPPVCTKTWFHTGAWLEEEKISQHLAHEYFGAPLERDPQTKWDEFEGILLPDTVFPTDLRLPDGTRLAYSLTSDEQREACRALKGSMLRQEVYALDGTPKQDIPYTVTEQNFTIEQLQPRADNHHAVFFTHAREALSCHYERNPTDPRIGHAMTLDVDTYGNVLKSIAIGYGRKQSALVEQSDRDKQTQTLITYTENSVTNPVDEEDAYRRPLPAEARTYELTGFTPENNAARFGVDQLIRDDFKALSSAEEIRYEQAADTTKTQKRPIEHVRTLYRKNDLTGLVPKLESLALPGESYKLAFTPELAKQIYVDSGKLSQAHLDAVLADEGKYVHSELDANWWIPSGRTFYHVAANANAADELTYARAHFFVPLRYRNPFHTDTLRTESFVTYDQYDLLVVETRDALDNRVAVGANDYRVLQPRLVSDPNGNQTEVAFDTLGLVVGTAVMGKPLPAPVEGDLLTGFVADLTQAQLDAFFDAPDPHAAAEALLQNATTCIVYDLDRFGRTRQANPNDPTQWQPVCAATLARETHVNAPQPPHGLKIQVSFSYSDGFGREIQKKIQAEPDNGIIEPAASSSSAELYDPATGTWTATGSLATARTGHTATSLLNGKVLVTSGFNRTDGYLASAELYDPASGTWTATGSLNTIGRYGHTATLLLNGKVLVTGGWNQNVGYLYLASAELYDPDSGTWTATGSLNTGREWHTATLLPNGKVLVAGGDGTTGYLSSAELYDPASGTWTAIGSLATERMRYTATLLPNGKVLVAGGLGTSSALASAELYDPASGTWTATGSLATAREESKATLLPNGKVLVAGGWNSTGGSLASAELYDPASGTWTATGSLAIARALHTATLLPNGKVLVAAGYYRTVGSFASAELYDPASGTWTATGSLAIARAVHTATSLPNGKVLVAAGSRYHLAKVRWVGSGWTIFNNKGKPVRQYEPFFSVTHRFEFGVTFGVSPVLFYDPVERVVATLHPNHSWEKVVFDPWQQTTYDVNDTVLNSDGTTDPKSDADVKGYFSRLPDADYLPTWHEQRIQLPESDPERVAADKTAIHRQTPAIAHLDTLGRIFLTIAANRFERNGATVEESYSTRVELDIEGNQHAVRDAIEQNGDKLGRVVMRYDYDMLGNRIHQASMEAGERWMLNDVVGKPIRAWDSRGFMRTMSYDQLRRPTALLVNGNGFNDLLAEKTVYGEGQGDASNLRTRVYQVYDGAGVVTSIPYDFKGNLLRSKRELAKEYKTTLDWSVAVPLEGDTYNNITTYDALNRPITVTTPDNSVYRPTFNEANLLDKVDVNIRGAQDDAGIPVFTPFVTNIDYNAKGQRELIAYANGAETTYTYDSFTFRLTQLRTTRAAGLNGLASVLFSDPAVVQDLQYTYDPAGNITRIADTALARLSNAGQADNDPCDYTYDAIYRLIEATGREHMGQTARDFAPQNWRDYDFIGLANFPANPNDFQAMRRYTERYEYDAVGNFQFMRHVANGGSWTREYKYEEDSLIEPATPAQPGKQSNRLTKTILGNPLNHTEPYTYTDAQGRDVHGCMATITGMTLTWDFKDQLQQVHLGGGGKAYYVYDINGQRVRKVIEDQNDTKSDERLYLGSFEIYRKFGLNALTRETLHIMDDKQRIALVETQTAPTSNAPISRFQLGNHLGSASLELDQASELITYEEYHPYGTTSFQAGTSAAEVSLKRYRYTGKERDEESALYYHGARYCAPWIGRWISCDPAELIDGVNRYAFVRNDPVKLIDLNGTQAEDKKEALPKKEAAASPTVSPTLHVHLSLEEAAFIKVLRKDEVKKAIVSGVTEELKFLETSGKVKLDVDYSTVQKNDLKPGELQVYLVSPDLDSKTIKELLLKHEVPASDTAVTDVAKQLEREHGVSASPRGSDKPGGLFVPIGRELSKLGEEPIPSPDQSKAEFEKTVQQTEELTGRAISKLVLHEIGHSFGQEHTKKKGLEVMSQPPHIMDYETPFHMPDLTKENLAKITFTERERKNITASVAKWLGAARKK